MPLIKLEDTDPHSCWGLWEIAENWQELLTQLDTHDQDLSFLRGISHLEKKKESLATRLVVKKILHHWGLSYEGIVKDACAKPSLAHSDFHISMSHAQGYGIAIVHRHKSIGIDIEYPRTKLLKIAPKFLSSSELQFAGRDLERLTICWVAKESIL
ncbi:MAG: hypothetical protein HC880_15220 [Bacteroidia bacterium]|nr:hypothetical protein [Bacteroidia bacterium]